MITDSCANLCNFMCNTGVGVHICTPSSWSSSYKFLHLELGVHQATFQSDSHEIMMTYLPHNHKWNFHIITTLYIQCITGCCAGKRKKPVIHCLDLEPGLCPPQPTKPKRRWTQWNLQACTCPGLCLPQPTKPKRQCALYVLLNLNLS